MGGGNLWDNCAGHTGGFDFLAFLEAFLVDSVASGDLFFIGHAKPIGLTCPPGLKLIGGIRRQEDVLIWFVTP